MPDIPSTLQVSGQDTAGNYIYTNADNYLPIESMYLWTSAEPLTCRAFDMMAQISSISQ